MHCSCIRMINSVTMKKGNSAGFTNIFKLFQFLDIQQESIQTDYTIHTRVTLIESVHSFSYKTYYLHKILDTESCNWLIKIMKQQDMFNVEIVSIT